MTHAVDSTGADIDPCYNAWIQEAPNLGSKVARRGAAREMTKGYARLDFFGKNLGSLPTHIGMLTRVVILNLGNNNLRSLPSEIGQLMNLSDLNVQGNQLETLPSEIGQLTNLIWLYANANQLRYLPSTIGNLGSLRSLSLEDNRLQGVPSEISKLSNLNGLNISNNQINVPLFEVALMPSHVQINADGNQMGGEEISMTLSAIQKVRDQHVLQVRNLRAKIVRKERYLEQANREQNVAFTEERARSIELLKQKIRHMEHEIRTIPSYGPEITLANQRVESPQVSDHDAN